MGNDRILRMPTGDTVTFLRTARETGGELVEFQGEVPPGGSGPPAHLHLGAEESFTVVEGLLELRLGRRRLRLGPGETATVPPGTAHTFANPTAAPVTFLTRMTPAGRFEELLRIQAAAGRLPPLLRIATVNRGPDASLFLAGIPVPVQRVLWNGLAALAHLLPRARRAGAG
jgi:mannose-6-phosphate isomerase-like protein (cupin superfamily)